MGTSSGRCDTPHAVRSTSELDSSTGPPNPARVNPRPGPIRGLHPQLEQPVAQLGAEEHRQGASGVRSSPDTRARTPSAARAASTSTPIRPSRRSPCPVTSNLPSNRRSARRASRASVTHAEPPDQVVVGIAPLPPHARPPRRTTGEDHAGRGAITASASIARATSPVLCGRYRRGRRARPHQPGPGKAPTSDRSLVEVRRSPPGRGSPAGWARPSMSSSSIWRQAGFASARVTAATSASEAGSSGSPSRGGSGSRRSAAGSSTGRVATPARRARWRLAWWGRGTTRVRSGSLESALGDARTRRSCVVYASS